MRKYIFYASIFVLLVLLLGLALVHAYLAPGDDPADDGLAAPDQALLGYFEPDYERSRAEFRRLATGLQEEHRGVERGAIVVPGQRDPAAGAPATLEALGDLTIDWVYVPAQAQPRRLLIVTSGIHGAEGPVGSAVQRYFMDAVLPRTALDEMSVLLVHALNPFGFRHTRRVAESNVDLNRNFDIAPDLFALQNPGYRAISGVLNPDTPVDLGSLESRLFAERAVLLIARHGMSALRQAVLQGQYEIARGVYFGGHAFEPHKAGLESLLERIIRGHGAVMLIDLHTGYGQRGTLHLYPNPPATEAIERDTEAVFAGYHIDWPHRDENFYSTTGGLIDWVGKLLDRDTQRYVPMVFEYGTLDSHTTPGAIDSLQRIVLENQGFHHGHASPSDEAEVRRRFSEMFYPSSPRWRTQVMATTRDLWPVILGRFAAL
jgi:hypothetical protein